MSHSDGDTFLLSELVLDDQKFNTIITNMYWENCTLRSWLNGYDSSYNLYGTDYSNNNFIDTAFTDEEQSKIKTTTVINNDSIKHQTEAGNNTEDKVFILSEEEVYGETAITYGFDENYKTEDINRQAKSSTYAKAMGVYADIETSTLGNCDWWLRTPGSYTGLFDLVQYDGKVYRGGQHADSKTRGVRPAIHINF